MSMSQVMFHLFADEANAPELRTGHNDILPVPSPTTVNVVLRSANNTKMIVYTQVWGGCSHSESVDDRPCRRVSRYPHVAHIRLFQGCREFGLNLKATMRSSINPISTI